MWPSAVQTTALPTIEHTQRERAQAVYMRTVKMVLFPSATVDICVRIRKNRGRIVHILFYVLRNGCVKSRNDFNGLRYGMEGRRVEAKREKDQLAVKFLICL